MAWIGKSDGIFKLHDSNRFCGSFMSVTDAAEILEVAAPTILQFAKKDEAGADWVSELDLHRRWGAGDIRSPHPVRVGAAKRSLDELILLRLVKVTFPNASVEIQVPFGRKRVDLVVELEGVRKAIEFLGPSHFIRQYERELESPLVRKSEAEGALGCECVLWPYWIQRCQRNVEAVFDRKVEGLASVWSTKALFGDFQLHESARIIVQLTERFNAVRADGIGYMYLASHTEKPVHPIVDRIQNGKVSKVRLIPRDNHLEDSFWLPQN